jgi:stage II sporulation protein D
VAVAAALCPLAASATSAAPEEGGDFVRVGLYYGEKAPASCTVYSESGFILGVMANGGFQEGMPLPAYTQLTFSVNGGYTAVHAEGVLVSDDFGGGNCVMPYDYASGGLVQYEKGAFYRGGLSFAASTGNRLTVVNYLSAEAYLYGVIDAEMGYKSPLEALKAQAVVARSFAAGNAGLHGDDGFDLCTTTHCQVYRGYGGEHAETNAAVDGTAGIKLYHQGQAASGYYFKNSGGHTQNSEDVWNGKEAYLRGVRDEYAPEYAWSWTASTRELRAKLAESGRDPGEIRSVSISARNVNGSVRTLKISGAAGAVTLEKEQIRTVLGATAIKSLRFTLNDGAQAPSDVYVTDGTFTGKIQAEAFAVSAGADAARPLLVKDARFQGASALSEPGGAGAGTGESASGESIVFSGNGYGHGVGMPQDSAIEMAKQGFTYAEIINKYFTDVEIRQ